MKIIKFIATTSRRLVESPSVQAILHKRSFLALPPPAAEEAQSSPPTTAPTTPQSIPKRRALLIGIQFYPDGKRSTSPTSPIAKGKAKLKQKCHIRSDSSSLKGCHKDVLDMKQVLVDLYGYEERDITTLMDDNDPNRILPTRDNIVEKMKELVADAQPGDTFFFFFAGHSTQKETDSTEEEDGKDELIVTYDNEMIQDDELRASLVNPLPIGARLIAVFDSCHSASLLDLKHFRCNRVYVPWINKGRRRSYTKWNEIVRRAAAPLSPRMSPRLENFPVKLPRRASPPNPRWKQSSIDQILDSAAGTPIYTPRETKASEHKNTPAPTQKRVLTIQTEAIKWLDTESSPIPRCASPEPMFCTGWCPCSPNAYQLWPEVISLSAAKDNQQAWEDANGSSMTQSLITILRAEPHPTLQRLLTLISHDLHEHYLSLHARSRDYKKKARLANLSRLARGKKEKAPCPVEMDNFQDPQISSLYPLDMPNYRWRL